jgi:hypothetical protein
VSEPPRGLADVLTAHLHLPSRFGR